MILEVAVLNVKTGQGAALESRKLLHHFYEPFPKVEHYERLS